MADRPRGLYEAPFQIEAPEKASQTLLSRVDVCPYSAALYLRHKGGPQTPAMARGEAFHDFAERATNMLISNGEAEMPPEVGKDLMTAVLEERTDLVVPASEQDACRLMAWNWALSTYIDPETIVGVEAMLEAEVAGWTIRGKLDLCRISGNVGIVEDWKTSLMIPSVEDYKRSFQPAFYAFLMAEGRVEGDTALGEGLAEIHTKELYPRYRREEDGQLVHRYDEFDRARIHDFRQTLTALLAKLDQGLKSGEWAASPGSHCATCPASSECPIPAHLRQIKTVGTPGDATELAMGITMREAEIKTDKAALKAWVDENGEVVVGDERWSFTLSRSERADKAAIKEALASAGLDPDAFYKESVSTRFGKKKVKS
jgi:hypothetical protein